MPSFSDSIFLFVLALLLFGPKKLPVLARELGKWVGEFRRASNEFKMQMEEELRLSEQEERRKKIEAVEAAAPASPVLDYAEHTELPSSVEQTETAVDAQAEAALQEDAAAPQPIATSGELKMMPPSTGLPTQRGSRDESLDGLIQSIPETSEKNHASAHADASPESLTHAG